jgi:hypothetical protein
MSNSTKLLFGMAQGLMVFITVVSLILTLYTVGPSIETRMFPAVSKLRILSMMSGPEPHTSVIQAEFTKLRNCEFLGIAWFKITPAGDFERVPVILLRKPGDNSSPNRPLGLQRAGPWQIGVDRDDIYSKSFARLTHQCHPLWPTSTEFFP